MSFFSNVKFLTNLFKAHSNICDIVSELENQCTSLKEQYKELKKKFHSSKTELEKINKLTEEVKEKLEFSKQRFEEMQSENYQMHQLESVEYINTLISEKGYKMEKLDLSKEPFKPFFNGSGSLCYQKLVILRSIKFRIQEFAAQEGLCYDKLQNSLFDINQTWVEAYDNAKNHIVKDTYTTMLLLTSFMMITKKNSDKKEARVIKHETYRN